jgi:hypothetical protein
MAPIRVVVPLPLEKKSRQVMISRNSAGENYTSILYEINNPKSTFCGGEIGVGLGSLAY